MATATASPLRSVQWERSSKAHHRSRGVIVVSALTILAVAIHGYHPYAEDGGIYLAGIKRVLHPDLYPFWSGFTTAHLRFSLFAPIVAFLVRTSHVSLMAVMLLLYVASIWATLFAAWQIALRCYLSPEARFGAVSLLALLLTVPVAGTSLMLMDPYVSARSISTPCSLFALAAVIDMARQVKHRERLAFGAVCLCFGSLFLAALVHPLMAVYALGCALILAIANLTDSKFRWAACGILCAIAITGAAILLRVTPPPPAGYIEVARTRTYWFLSSWHWYELVGLVAPLLVLALIRLWFPNPSGAAVKSLAQTALIAGALSIGVAILFARANMSSYAVARLQPLRVFQTIYVITIISVGAWLGQFVIKRSVRRWAGMIASLGALMFFVQLEAFAHSSHLEFPWIASANGWGQAFAWTRSNTPRNALFALDADYIAAPGEDAQNFRAIAERSAAPDYSKDGGIASIAPDLTAEWSEGEVMQKGLDQATDADRVLVLRSLSAQWVVLSSAAVTAFDCPYTNSAAKVCRVPRSKLNWRSR